MPTDRRYAGERQETSIGGLYDFGARFYSPMLGRFISADSDIPDPFDSQSLNRYAYTRNNPLTRIDPTGSADECNPALYNCGVPYTVPIAPSPYYLPWNYQPSAPVAPTPVAAPSTPTTVAPSPAIILALPAAAAPALPVLPPVLPYVVAGLAIGAVSIAFVVGFGYLYAQSTSNQPSIPYPAAQGTLQNTAIQPGYPLQGTGTVTTRAVVPTIVLQINENIKGEDLPGRLQREFPSQHFGKTLRQIKEELKTATGEQKRSLQKAKKLLEQRGRLMKKTAGKSK